MSSPLRRPLLWLLLCLNGLANAPLRADLQGDSLVPPRAELAATPAPSPASASPAPSLFAGPSTDTMDENRKLTVGDRLSYRVIEDKDPAVSLVVTDSGEVDVPLLGRVAAAGKTCRELAASVTGPLEKRYFIKATVVVSLDIATMRSPGRVYVTGVVAEQGPQDIPPNEIYTLSKAITRAGGVSEFGNIHRVKIVRKDSSGAVQNLVVDLGEIINRGRIDKDPILLPNDMIVVPRKLINF